VLQTVTWKPSWMRAVTGHVKGGPEHLENEINKILGSRREDRFQDHFSDLVQICVRFVFRTCCAFGSFFVPASRALFMVPDP